MRPTEATLDSATVMFDRQSSLSLLARARGWGADCLAPYPDRKKTSHKLLVPFLCLTIFTIALTVRYLHWQDRNVEIVWSRTSLAGLFERYNHDALRILNGGGVLFPTEAPTDGDAKLLVYPPGYSLLLAGIIRITTNQNEALWIIQALADGVSAVVIFFFAGELFNRQIAFLAGMLVGLSPHLAHYSLLLSPDTLPILPVLLAIWLIIRAARNPSHAAILGAG